MLSDAMPVSPNPVDPRCWTKSEQLTVASGYWAAPEVSDPPEVVAPDEEAVYPEGKSEAGSSTDSRPVPVSWPAAAGSGVIDAVGSDPVAGAVAGDVADVGCDEGVAYGVPLVEHPATVATVPAAIARTASPGRSRRKRRARPGAGSRGRTTTSRVAKDGTGLPTLIRTRTLTTYPPPSAALFTDRELETPEARATGPVGKLAADRGWRAARRPE